MVKLTRLERVECGLNPMAFCATTVKRYRLWLVTLVMTQLVAVVVQCKPAGAEYTR